MAQYRPGKSDLTLIKSKALALAIISALFVKMLLIASVPSLRAVTEAPKLQWEKTYGHIRGISVVEITDEGYEGFLIAAEKGDEYYYIGHGAYNCTNKRYVLVKTDLGGHVHWMKELPYEVSTMIPAKEGGFTIAGYRNSGSHIGLEVVLEKIDVEGNGEWIMAYSQGDVVAHIAFLIQAQDGGYVLGGYINLQSNTPDKAWVLKTDSAGGLQWNNTYGGNCDDPPNRILSVEQTDHGGFICVGNVDGTSLMQLDALGRVQFTKTYSDLSLNFVVRTDDGGYLFVGNEHDVIKTDSNLEFLWQRTYSETYVSRALKDILDDGYLLYTSGGIMKVDSSGNVEWSKRYPASIRCLIQTEDKGFAYVSTRCEGMGVCYIWLVKIAPEPINQQTEPPPLEPLPTAWILIAVVIVAVMGIGLLVYLNKHKGWYLSKEKY